MDIAVMEIGASIYIQIYYKLKISENLLKKYTEKNIYIYQKWNSMRTIKKDDLRFFKKFVKKKINLHKYKNIA